MEQEDLVNIVVHLGGQVEEKEEIIQVMVVQVHLIKDMPEVVIQMMVLVVQVAVEPLL